ncbi:MAG: helix-turn-helix transcriptional regulator [Clostridia bacterium]|nr:helix-turn-helix transcriptional regulator [Clostridia bacterium]
MDKQEFGQRIAKLRTNRALSQQQLAQMLGVKRSVISYYESGDRLPSFDVLIMMSRVFSVSTDYLLKGQEKTRNLDVTGLEEKEIEILSSMVNALRDGKQMEN